MQAPSYEDTMNAFKLPQFPMPGYPSSGIEHRTDSGYASRYQPYYHKSTSSLSRPLYGSEFAHPAITRPRFEGDRTYYVGEDPTGARFDHGSTDSDSEQNDEDAAELAHLSKEELRKHKNRQSAARSRQRSRQRMEQLERMVKELSEKNIQLEHEVRVLSIHHQQRQQQQQQQQAHPMQAMLPYYHH